MPAEPIQDMSPAPSLRPWLRVARLTRAFFRAQRSQISIRSVMVRDPIHGDEDHPGRHRQLHHGGKPLTVARMALDHGLALTGPSIPLPLDDGPGKHRRFHVQDAEAVLIHLVERVLRDKRVAPLDRLAESTQFPIEHDR
ncbi:MAG TPA: hypothetical protein VK824_02580 [Planctomycetota bacterium]|nr:hypothetical protein [Planctomycetota bacterium]